MIYRTPSGYCVPCRQRCSAPFVSPPAQAVCARWKWESGSNREGPSAPTSGREECVSDNMPAHKAMWPERVYRDDEPRHAEPARPSAQLSAPPPVLVTQPQSRSFAFLRTHTGLAAALRRLLTQTLLLVNVGKQKTFAVHAASLISHVLGRHPAP